jgi:hypothetical protein
LHKILNNKSVINRPKLQKILAGAEWKNKNGK